MPKFRKKPVIIDAFQLGLDPVEDWFTDKVMSGEIRLFEEKGSGRACCTIETLEGAMEAKPHDYILKGVQGEIYPCKPDIFKLTYDRYPEHECVSEHKSGA